MKFREEYLFVIVPIAAILLIPWIMSGVLRYFDWVYHVVGQR